MNTDIKMKDYIFLHISLFIYSFATIFGKIASQFDFFSFKFILFYAMSIGILFIYAILWQQNLKRIPLAVAFANKSIIVIWGIIWGSLLFGEKITIPMLIGSIIIFFGINMVIKDEE